MLPFNNNTIPNQTKPKKKNIKEWNFKKLKEKKQHITKPKNHQKPTFQTKVSKYSRQELSPLHLQKDKEKDKITFNPRKKWNPILKKVG